jgi:hypothetical protein
MQDAPRPPVIFSLNLGTTMINVIAYESWKLDFQEQILVDLKHSTNGLKTGTILKSKSRNLSWKVNSRTIFTQAEQKTFEGETESLQHFSFRSDEDLSKFVDALSRKEAQGIYQYGIIPIDHNGRPMYGEELEVISE